MNSKKLVVVLVFATVISMARVGSAAITCTNASLNGVFGYTHGRSGGAFTVEITFVVGQLTFDGLGNITSASWTWTNDGTITTGTTTGTYSISANCNGSLTLNNEDQADAHFDIYLNAGDKMFQMVQTDTGWDQPGFGLAQGTVQCGLTGQKRMVTTNIIGVTSGDMGDIEDAVGKVTLDGKGHISGTETFTFNGARF